MTVTDVLKLAIQFLGEPDLAKTSTLGGTASPTQQQTAKLNSLLACVNDVVQSLALMYFPLKYEEVLENETGQISFSSLSKTVNNIVKVIDNHGFDADFATFPTYFETTKGQIRIIYYYTPAYLSNFSDSLEVALDKVSLRMVALGVVSRYFLINGLFSDAQEWNDMFERAILVAQRDKKPKTIKKRKWV